MKRLIFFLSVVFLISSCKKNNLEIADTNSNVSLKDTIKYKIEFIELGSVNCIPCKKMQPIMKSIESKYKGLVKVTFYDVWKEKGISEQYGIDLIPTQVFKDSTGKEIMRHQGFFREEEIDKFLLSKGLNFQ